MGSRRILIEIFGIITLIVFGFLLGFAARHPADAPAVPATIAVPSPSPWADALSPLPRPEPDPRAAATRAALERLAARLADADARCRKLEAALKASPDLAPASRTIRPPGGVEFRIDLVTPQPAGR